MWAVCYFNGTRWAQYNVYPTLSAAHDVACFLIEQGNRAKIVRTK